jgi:hypothetical protein
MPNYKKLLCVAIALAGLATVSLAQADDPIQTLAVNMNPTKLDKKKFKSIELGFDIQTGPNSTAAVNQDQPPNATKTVVDFPKNLKIDTENVPHCLATPDQLENTTTEQAIELCGKKSIISVPSKSSAHVTADLNPGVADPSATVAIPVVLTAFNGTTKNTLIFHNRADSVNNTTILNEKLKPSTDKKYGTQLITIIPPVLAGGVDDFMVTIKKGTIASARCKSTKNPFQITSTFPDLTPPTVQSTTKTTCTQKK